MSTRSLSLALLFATLFCGNQAIVADIVVLERESFGEFSLFAGSGGATSSYDNSMSMNGLTGGFMFSDSGTVAVSEADPFSNGAAMASGSINISDLVDQVSANELILSGSRIANGHAEWMAGTGLARSLERQVFRVRFSVTNTPVQYSLTGTFDPGITTGMLGEAGNMSLRRPFTSLTFFNISSAGPVSETGLMQPGNTYEFRLLMTDFLGASAGNPGPVVDASSTGFQIRFSSVPEPCGAGLSALLSMVALTRRTPRRRHNTMAGNFV